MEELTHDERIIWSLKFEIEKYRTSKKKNLPALANRIDAYIRGLFDCEPELRRKMHERWWDIEEINAVALMEDKTQPLKEDEELFETVLGELSDLISQWRAPSEGASRIDKLKS